MVDVGPKTGALVLAASQEFHGVEVEIHRVGDSQHRSHVWILPRESRHGVTYAAVFPRLAIGDYAILASDGSLDKVITIPPNEVTYTSWMQSTSPEPSSSTP